MTMLSTPDQLDRFHMAQVIAGLKIQARTGMRHSRGSVIDVARDVYGCKKRTAAGALDEMLALYRATWGEEYGHDRRR